MTAVLGHDNFREHVPWADVVLTWGPAAEPAAAAAREHVKPYIVMVRWWRNVVPIPPAPGSIRERDIPPRFFRVKRILFREAAAVICNNRWSAGVVGDLYGCTTFVSYVAVEGAEPLGHGFPEGPVVVVTDGKELGAERTVKGLAQMLPHREFLVVNAKDPGAYPEANIETTGYLRDMTPVWEAAGIMLYPNYGNDVCGTSRCAVEFMRYGVPAVSNDRCGICEKGMFGLSPDATVEEWASMIEQIYADYDRYAQAARCLFEAYDSEAQLRVYRAAVERAAVSAKQQLAESHPIPP